MVKVPPLSAMVPLACGVADVPMLKISVPAATDVANVPEFPSILILPPLWLKFEPDDINKLPLIFNVPPDTFKLLPERLVNGLSLSVVPKVMVPVPLIFTVPLLLILLTTVKVLADACIVPPVLITNAPALAVASMVTVWVLFTITLSPPEGTQLQFQVVGFVQLPVATVCIVAVGRAK